jgi:hypothetical protein
VVVGQQVTASRTVLECRLLAGDDDAFCHRCGAESVTAPTIRMMQVIVFGIGGGLATL